MTNQPDKVKNFWQSFPWSNSDHQAKWVLLKNDNSEKGIFILNLLPHAKVENHNHPTLHYGIVLDGELKIVQKDKQKIYKSGEVYFIDKCEVHGGSPGPNGCVLLELRDIEKKNV